MDGDNIYFLLMMGTLKVEVTAISSFFQVSGILSAVDKLNSVSLVSSLTSHS